MDSFLAVHPGQHFRSHLDRWRDWDATPASGKAAEDTHHGMEINFVERGKVRYLFGGSILTLPDRTAASFLGRDATPGDRL